MKYRDGSGAQPNPGDLIQLDIELDGFVSLFPMIAIDEDGDWGRHISITREMHVISDDTDKRAIAILLAREAHKRDLVCYLLTPEFIGWAFFYVIPPPETMVTPEL